MLPGDIGIEGGDHRSDKKTVKAGRGVYKTKRRLAIDPENAAIVQNNFNSYVNKVKRRGTTFLFANSAGELIRKINALFDEDSSQENAKHVLRCMVEKARQGFWNGSRPPFGYRLVVVEARGEKPETSACS